MSWLEAEVKAMSNSERALGRSTARVPSPLDPLHSDTPGRRVGLEIPEAPRDPYDRDRLREEWRLAALAWAAAEDEAARLDEGRKVLLDRMTLELVREVRSTEKARMMARTSDEFGGYLQRLHTAKRRANDARISMQNADRLYWAHVGSEANERVERRMSR
jgi:hypothetical protein